MGVFPVAFLRPMEPAVKRTIERVTGRSFAMNPAIRDSQFAIRKDPEPRNPTREPRTANGEIRNANRDPRAVNREPRTPTLGSLRIPDPGSRTPAPGVSNHD
jgi:hypothetical protein